MYKVEVTSFKRHRVTEYGDDWTKALRAFHRAVARAVDISCDVYLWADDDIVDSFEEFERG